MDLFQHSGVVYMAVDGILQNDVTEQSKKWPAFSASTFTEVKLRAKIKIEDGFIPDEMPEVLIIEHQKAAVA